MTAPPEPRTHLQACNDLAYEIRFQTRSRRFYKRMRLWLGVLAAIAGSAAFINVVSSQPALLAVGGVVVAGCAYIESHFGLAEKIAAHESQRKRYLVLESKIAGLSVDELDAELSILAMDDPDEIESLKRPSFNDMLITRGYVEDVERLGFREKLMNLIA